MTNFGEKVSFIWSVADILRMCEKGQTLCQESTAEAAEYIQVWTVDPRPRAVPPTAHPARNSFERVIDAVRAAE